MELRRSARLAVAKPAAQEEIPGWSSAKQAVVKRRKTVPVENVAAPPVKRKRAKLELKENADPEPSRKLTKSRIVEEPYQQKTKLQRLKRFPSRDLEMELWGSGYLQVIGVDEAGRGPLAGPVVAAACIIPPSVLIEGVHDSKKLTAEKREQLYSQIVSSPGVLFSVCVVDAARIDEINILQATMQAMRECVSKLTEDGSHQYVLIDGNRIPDGLPVECTRCVIKGDAECHIIAAASILAKVTRDRLMDDYDRKWPLYGFKDHRGYGTASHTAALLKYGPCDIHRRSFAPLKNQKNE